VLLCCACAAKKKAIEKAGERDKLEQEKEENTRKEEEDTEHELIEPEGENQDQREDAERETEVSLNHSRHAYTHAYVYSILEENILFIMRSKSSHQFDKYLCILKYIVWISNTKSRVSNLWFHSYICLLASLSFSPL
jgi:hypothetical protein